jgi:uncharacterized protein
MPYFVLFYDTVEDYVARRAPHREEHLALAREALLRGELVMGGALSDPADRALLVFQASSPAVAENFALRDPYVVHGLVTRWQVRQWNVVIGGDPPVADLTGEPAEDPMPVKEGGRAPGSAPNAGS